MINILSLSLTVLVAQTPPPPPPPPVGDVVPLDSDLWILLATALIIGAIVVYKRFKTSL
ncbi:hypothetical protein [Nonlabens sp.]|uniref:hypothetical protein n=1 Tax=Nonlabens sp. TaxID=1888209 RepID=UPI003F699377